jgi:hypothetical protein
MAGLGDPAGEVNITRGAGKTGIIQGVGARFHHPETLSPIPSQDIQQRILHD